jgi:predicted small lipoprotein YifL
MGRTARLIVIGLLVLAFALPVMACGRKGPLEDTPQSATGQSGTKHAPEPEKKDP